MEASVQNKNRKLQGALLILMLLLFLVVYNRRQVQDLYLDEEEEVTMSPAEKRSMIPWNKKRADSSISIVRDGDLILRSGSDAISGLFKRVNLRDKSYSHAGIVFIENGYPFVYNTMGSADHPDAPIKRDSLVRYIGSYDNLGYAVYRFRLSKSEVEKLHDIAKQYYREVRTFDPYFDLTTDTALYCTEFVYKAMIAATGKKDYFPTTQSSNFSYVAVDNLFLRKDIALVCKIVYMQ